MKLGQYYTPDSFSTLLINNMNSKEAEIVLDIGCGQANLLSAARKRWEKAKLIGFDIDPKNYCVRREDLHIEFGNGFDPDLSQKIIDNFGYIDISVANPPYTYVEVNQNISKILKKSQLSQCIPSSLKKIPSEIVFLAQNLIVLKESGELGAILPASIISGEKWKYLREYLITEKGLNRVIQLPNKVFHRTEASTFVVNLCRSTREKCNDIELMSYECDEKLSVDVVNGIRRLDYSYHSHLHKLPYYTDKIYVDTMIMYRGRKSSKELYLTGSAFLHTKDLKENFQLLEYEENLYENGQRVAEKGDLVISRVGSRCVGKSALITKGRIEVSDCIIVIKNVSSKKVTEHFISGKFYQAMMNCVLGTGAKYLTFNIIKEALEAYEF
ncbi:MAG: class I SAM-dependent DNA methyltransferase [Shewanella algae]